LPTTALQVNNTAITTAQIFPTVTGGSVALVLPIPGSGREESDSIEVFACGWATVGGVTPNLNVTMYSGTSLTPGSNTVLAVLGAAQTVTTSASYDWAIWVRLFGSIKTGKVQGSFQIEIDNTVSAVAALTNPLTAQNPGSEPFLNLVVGITFGVANAANVAQLSRFYANSLRLM
jgi:hypothetical protein